MADVQAKSKEIYAEKKSLQDSINVALFFYKGLENEVSELTNKVVSASSIYFECAKVRVIFLYPVLHLSL